MLGSTAILLLALLAPASTAHGSSPDPEVFFNEGVRLYARENYKKAVEAFEKAVRAAPRTAEYQLWLARAYGRRAERISKWKWWTVLSMARKTRAGFERAVELDGSNQSALSDLLDFYIEAPGIVGGGLGRAEAIAQRIAGLNPAAGERAWAAIYEKREEFDKAEAKLRQALELEPGNIGHLLSLASFLARRGDYAASDQLYEQAFRRQPDSPDVWFSRAKALVRAKRNPAEARSLLERYLTATLEPNATPRSEARKLLKQL